MTPHLDSSAQPRPRILLACLALALAAIALVAATTAHAGQTHHYTGTAFGPDGSATTAFVQPAGIAIDQQSHAVYVADPGTGSIYKFDENHQPANFSALGSNQITGIAFRGGAGESQIAVDSSSHLIYATSGNSILAFHADGTPAEFSALASTEISGFSELLGVAVDANGDIYGGDYNTGVHVYEPSGAPLAAFSVASAGNLAVDSHGAVYVNHWQGAVQKFAPSALPVTATTTYASDPSIGESSPGAANGNGIVNPGPVLSLAVDPSNDHVYTDRGAEVALYDSAGAPLGAFGAGQLSGSQGLALSAATGDVYVANSGEQRVDLYGPALPTSQPATAAAGARTKISATLNGEVDPEGAEVTECAFEYGQSESYGQTAPCVTAGGGPVGSGSAPVAVHADLSGLQAGRRYHFRLVSANANGGARGADLTFFTVSPGFGFQPGSVDLSASSQDNTPVTQAGSHPYQVTTSFTFNNEISQFGQLVPSGGAKDVRVTLPPGLVGNANALPQCTEEQFSTEHGGTRAEDGTNHNNAGPSCENTTVVGIAKINFQPDLNQASFLPIYNLVPPVGAPAEFGFVVAGGVPVRIVPSLRTDDYALQVDSNNTSQGIRFYAAKITFWGVPGDPRHNPVRGSCLEQGSIGQEPEPTGESCPAGVTPVALLTLPTACGAPLYSRIEADSWQDPGTFVSAEPTFIHDGAGNPLSVDGCNRLHFTPEISARPTTDRASAPTGLDFELNVDDPGLTSPGGIAQSDIKKTVVTLPEGFTTNPSVAAGLGACSEAQFESEALGTEPGAGCPNDSKVGDVEIESPLVAQKIDGSLYIAEQHRNPFHTLLALYIVARNPEIGILVKLAGKVEPNPVTGQLTTTFDNLPQLPVSHFRLSFRQGQRSPLISPPGCGTFTAHTDLTPYSDPEAVRHDESSFTITKGFDGGACPSGGTPSFHPELQAGSYSNQAGGYSPFYVKLARNDGEQEFTHFSIKLPPGVIGKLAGVTSCPDAAIAQAKAREREGGGGEEEASPSCPANSEVGHTLVGSGVGNVLAYAPGKLYLAGPYHGSNISLVSITAAKVGPFDLGTVVVRFALKIDPETAEVSVDGATSDPIPHIVDGIPVHLREIRSYVDRPQFTLNPTSCERTSTASAVLGSGLDFASAADDKPVTVTSPFQVANCALLGFKPKLALSLRGGTKRGATPAFKAVLTARPGDANIGEAQVTLPHSEFLEQSHIGTVCTRTQFKEGKVPGEKCPKASIYGRARATTPILSEPLEGPVYLRSSSHQLPDLVAALHNNQVDIALDGRIDSVENGRIRNTFEAVPDAPVTKFTLEMLGGKKGLLVNSTNICAKKNRAISAFTGQNGKTYDTNPVLKASCGGHGKKKTSKR